MSFEHACADELPPEVDILLNGRRRVTRRFPLKKNGNIDDIIYRVYGAEDPGPITSCTTGYSNLKLIAQKVQPAANPLFASTLVQVFETLTDEFVAETGDVTDYDMNGLERVTRTLIAEAGTDFSEFVVGMDSFVGASGTIYLAKVRVENTEAYVRVVAEYLEPGVVSRTIRQLDGGLREESISSFYTRVVPTGGIIVYDKEDNEEGYPVFVVSAMQSKTGGDPTDGSAEMYSQLETFTYPGRAKLFTQTKTYGAVNFNFTDLYLSNPISQSLECIVDVSYSTSSSIGALAYPLWNPKEWATLNAVYLTENSVGGGRSKVQALDGYIVEEPDSDNIQSITFASSAGEAAIAFGSFLNTGFGGEATISGGPNTPAGSTWTLRYSVDPAFVDTAGVQYYKHTLLICDVPAQPALPV